MQAARERYDVLDGLRGIAAFSVMIYHYCQQRSFQPLPHANLAVDLFFVLSGFVLAHSYGNALQKNMSMGEYSVRRVIRIYPLYLIGLCFSLPVFYAMSMNGVTGFTFQDIASAFSANFFMLPFFFDIPSIGENLETARRVFPTNNPSWSLFFEMIVSLLLLPLFRLRGRFLAAIIGASLLLFFAHSVLLAIRTGLPYIPFDAGFNTTNFWGGFPKVIYGFALGIFIYKQRSFLYSLFARIWNSMPYKITILFAVVLIVFAVPLWIKGLYNFAAITTAIPLIVLLGSMTKCKSKIAQAACDQLGALSFPLYCLHIPVFYYSEIMIEHFAPTLSQGVLSVAIPAIATTALSFAALKFYDEPVRAALTAGFIKARKAQVN